MRASRRLPMWGSRRGHNAVVGVDVTSVTQRGRVDGPNVVQLCPSLLPVLFRECNEGEGGGVWSGHDYVTIVLMFEFIIKRSLGLTDASGQGDRGADITLFAQCSLKLDPSSLVLEFHFHGHGVESAQGAVSITVDLGGAAKKLSVLDHTHGVCQHPDVLGGNRRVGTGL